MLRGKREETDKTRTNTKLRFSNVINNIIYYAISYHSTSTEARLHITNEILRDCNGDVIMKLNIFQAYIAGCSKAYIVG